MGLIKSVAELDFPTKIKILIYGEPGLGKTSAALSMPSPLLFDCDEGIHRVNASFIKATVQPKTYQEILNVLDNEDLSSFRTIVIDGAKKLLDLMEMDIVSSPRAKVDKLVQGNGTLSLRGFGERLRMFEALNKKIAYQNKHVVYVAHQTTTGDSDNLRHVPEFGGSSYAQLATAMDLIGHIEADEINTFYNYFGAWFKNEREINQGLIAPLSVEEIAAHPFYTPEAMRKNNVIGQAQEVIDRLKAYEAMGYNEYSFWIDTGMSFERKKASLERMINQVMPAFA